MPRLQPGIQAGNPCFRGQTGILYQHSPTWTGPCLLVAPTPISHDPSPIYPIFSPTHFGLPNTV